METTPRQTLRVEIKAREEGDQWDTTTEIVWTLPGGIFPPLRQTVSCGVSNLRRLRHQLAEAYDRIHGDKGSDRNLGTARGNLRAVLKRAHAVGLEFFKNQASEMTTWLRAMHGLPLQWEIEAEPNSMFALDMLPLGWMSLTKEQFGQYLHNHPTLTTDELASMLPCWQWPVIRRLRTRAQPQRGLLFRKGKARVAFVGDDALSVEHGGTVEDGLSKTMRIALGELRTHPNLSAEYEIEDHWPDEEEVETQVLVSALATHLLNPGIMPRGCKHPDNPAVITHFFCHGKTTIEMCADSSKAKVTRGQHFELHIGQMEKKKLHHRITASELEQEIQSRDSSNAAGSLPKSRTLVFMNACATGLQARYDDAAIVSVFVNNGHPAVIGTEARVDTSTARKLSARFYECLLDAIPAHLALWQAQRGMTSESAMNARPFPAALLYSCYGIPDCRLEPRKEGVPAPISPLTGSDLFFPPKNVNLTAHYE